MCHSIHCLIADVSIFHGGQRLPNNSLVTVNDIGEDLEGLFCLTNKEDCCDSVGTWLFPDDTVVTSQPDANVYELRGLSILSLNRAFEMEVDNGLFRCEIPSADGVTQTLYVGIYSDGAGNLKMLCVL